MSNAIHEEMKVLLKAIHSEYGYDFQNYAPASLKRRINVFLERNGIDDYKALTQSIKSNPDVFESLLESLAVTVTELFRDPHFYKAFRKEVLPKLKTYPTIRIWLAGCATGEEAYSLAMLLHEEELLHKTIIYATDFNKKSIAIGKEGEYPKERFQNHERFYLEAGGKHSLEEYYTDHGENISFNAALKKAITFSTHNLVTDQVFNEMHVIICRNVFIYFNQLLQDYVLRLFHDSLAHNGFLCLGPKETIQMGYQKKYFSPVNREIGIYKRIINEGPNE